jgi:methylenetetrahydrofolate--tRNA-(uracil-5-)-methyltransferase
MERVYFAARWDKGTADYINCPMDRAEYDRFLDALLAAEAAEAKEWEKLDYFEGCLPIEVLARRGRDTLRFGPMKPVGLRDPRTGKTPWAVVQLRKENLRADSYNLVGFQNHLKFGEQARVLRLIPGLENARFLRYGQIHRNTYICAPAAARRNAAAGAPRPACSPSEPGMPHPCASCGKGGRPTHHSLCRPAFRRRGLHGVHRHRPAGRNLRGCNRARRGACPVPRATALGSLVHYITHADPKTFSPPTSPSICWSRSKKSCARRFATRRSGTGLVCERSLAAFDAWWSAMPHPAAELRR